MEKYLKYKKKYLKLKNIGGSSLTTEVTPEVTPQEKLITACKNKDVTVDILRNLFDSNPSLEPNLTDSVGRTCLMLAIKSGKLEVIKYLIEEKGTKYDDTIRDKNGSTCVIHACGNGHLHILKYLIDEKGAKYDDTNNKGQNCTMLSCLIGNLDIFKYLIDEKKCKYDETIRDGNGFTYVILASAKGHLEILKYLIEEKGAKYDETIRDNNGNTCVVVACIFDKLDILTYLIEVKLAKYNDMIRDNKDRTCTILASFHGHLTILEYLIDKGAEYDHKVYDIYYNDCLGIAIIQGNNDIVSYLLYKLKPDNEDDLISLSYENSKKNKDDIIKLIKKYQKERELLELVDDNDDSNLDKIRKLFESDLLPEIDKLRDTEQKTCAMITIKKNNINILKYLVEEGATINNTIIDEFDNTCTLLASQYSIAILRYLVSQQISTNDDIKNKLGETCIMCAIIGNNMETLEFLIKENGKYDDDIRNIINRTCVMLAIEYDTLDILKYLIDIQQAKFDNSIRDIDGFTCTILASSLGKLEILKYLIEEKRAEYNNDVKSNFGYTCLMVASRNGHLDVVEYLIKNLGGYDDSIVDKDGYTCLVWAIISNNTEIIDCLTKSQSIDKVVLESIIKTKDNLPKLPEISELIKKENPSLKRSEKWIGRNPPLLGGSRDRRLSEPQKQTSSDCFLYAAVRTVYKTIKNIILKYISSTIPVPVLLFSELDTIPITDRTILEEYDKETTVKPQNYDSIILYTYLYWLSRKRYGCDGGKAQQVIIFIFETILNNYIDYSTIEIEELPNIKIKTRATELLNIFKDIVKTEKMYFKVVTYYNIKDLLNLLNCDILLKDSLQKNNDHIVISIRFNKQFIGLFKKINKENLEEICSRLNELITKYEQESSSGHAMNLLYNNNDNKFTIMNSWGKTWGIEGFLPLNENIFNENTELHLIKMFQL